MIVDLLRRASADDAPLIVLITNKGDEGDQVLYELDKTDHAPYSLLAVTPSLWYSDLSPWRVHKMSMFQSDFSGGADIFLKKLTETIVPSACEGNGLKPSAIYIAGYSLAGLFALYSLYKTDFFAGCASCSGSLWFPGFFDFVHENKFAVSSPKIYLSLGDREAQTKNPLMSTVEDNTRGIAEHYEFKGYNVLFEMNQGGHLNGPCWRTAKGITWLLK